MIIDINCICKKSQSRFVNKLLCNCLRIFYANRCERKTSQVCVVRHASVTVNFSMKIHLFVSNCVKIFNKWLTSLAITDSENTFVQRKVQSPSTTRVLDKEMVTNQTGKLKPSNLLYLIKIKVYSIVIFNASFHFFWCNYRRVKVWASLSGCERVWPL